MKLYRGYLEFEIRVYAHVPCGTIFTLIAWARYFFSVVGGIRNITLLCFLESILDSKNFDIYTVLYFLTIAVCPKNLSYYYHLHICVSACPCIYEGHTSAFHHLISSKSTVRTVPSIYTRTVNYDASFPIKCQKIIDSSKKVRVYPLFMIQFKK